MMVTACNLYALHKQQGMIYNAGCLKLPFFRHRSLLLQPKTLSFVNSLDSIWCCIENILLAAASEGVVLRVEKEIFLKERAHRNAW